MWSKLRDRQLGGYKFRRQQPIGPYVADFYCAEAALVVEIDGRMHDPGHDQRRDAWMAARGIMTLRFTASLLSKDIDTVLHNILHHARQRSAQHPPNEQARTSLSP